MHATEDMMATSQALEAQQKKELVSKEEKTVPARYFVPTTDIFETADALTVVMELPGVDKQALDVNIENGVLLVEGRIDHYKYEGMDPPYTEYNVGNFARSFTSVEQDRPTADQRAAPRRRADPDTQKGEGGDAAADRDQLTRRSREGTELGRGVGVYEIKRAASPLD